MWDLVCVRFFRSIPGLRVSEGGRGREGEPHRMEKGTRRTGQDSTNGKKYVFRAFNEQRTLQLSFLTKLLKNIC